jgi:hypothetical protein
MLFLAFYITFAIVVAPCALVDKWFVDFYYKGYRYPNVFKLLYVSIGYYIFSFICWPYHVFRLLKYCFRNKP